MSRQDKSILGTDFSIRHHKEFASQWCLRIRADREQFTEVALLNHIWFRQRFQDSFALVIHFWMTAHDMLPPFFGQSNGHAVA